ncbi:MAG: chromate efflux transporter [Chloroflexi bacterium]|nr:chromate efflux transporter [Chloroflexota bacterium]
MGDAARQCQSAPGSLKRVTDPPDPDHELDVKRPVGRALEVFLVALRLGLTSFGGPIAHIGYFRREYVDRRRWLDEATFADLVTLCQLLPGPASSQLGIAIGSRRAGIPGGILAWLGFTLPSAIAMILFGLFAASTDVSGSGWVHGLKLAAVAVVSHAVWLMARTLTPDWRRRTIAALASVVALAWPAAFAQVAIMAGAALVGRLVLAPPCAPGPQPEPRRSPFLSISGRTGGLALGLFIALLVGLPILHAVAGSVVALVDAFYRTGSLVFGGGHVVLPLLHDAVVEPGWVSDGQFLAGYGATQAMPGPLFTFAGFLGTVSTQPPGGVAGGALALIAIFVPSFLLVFGALPFWDRLRTAHGVRRALAGTKAAVVGILLAALITPILTSAITNPIDVAIAAVGLALLASGRVPPIAVVVVSAAAGWLAADVPK